MEIIGKLPVPFERVDGKLVFSIEPETADTELRADFTLANREIQEIRTKHGDAISAELMERIAVLQGYKKAIRDLIVARRDARTLLAEEVELPDETPAAVAAVKDEVVEPAR